MPLYKIKDRLFCIRWCLVGFFPHERLVRGWGNKLGMAPPEVFVVHYDLSAVAPTGQLLRGDYVRVPKKAAGL